MKCENPTYKNGITDKIFEIRLSQMTRRDSNSMRKDNSNIIINDWILCEL